MKIREANIDDLVDIFLWRNDLASRQMFGNGSIITLEEHNEWFRKSLSDPLKKIFIGIKANKKIGVCRFEECSITNKSEASINLNPEMRGKKYSFYFLSKSIFLYRKSKFIHLRAIIKKENKASLLIFLKCGFFIISEDDIFFYLINNGIINEYKK
jgi:L-amino acid N-acyltransferase YncA